MPSNSLMKASCDGCNVLTPFQGTDPSGVEAQLVEVRRMKRKREPSSAPDQHAEINRSRQGTMDSRADIDQLVKKAGQEQGSQVERMGQAICLSLQAKKGIGHEAANSASAGDDIESRLIPQESFHLPGQTVSLLDLPAEIQNIIWTLVATEDRRWTAEKICASRYCLWETDPPPEPVVLRLLCVCRKINTEVSAFASEQVLTFCDHGCFQASFDRRSSSRSIQNIGEIRVNLRRQTRFPHSDLSGGPLGDIILASMRDFRVGYMRLSLELLSVWPRSLECNWNSTVLGDWVTLRSVKRTGKRGVFNT